MHAQVARSGRRGRRFESCHSDQSFQLLRRFCRCRYATFWRAFGAQRHFVAMQVSDIPRFTRIHRGALLARVSAPEPAKWLI
jgi:hypothetical protein